MCRSFHDHRDFDETRERREPRTFDPAMRASDADRQRVIEQLRKHVADGRLTLDEFAGRVGEAWGVKTQGELRTVLRDLPALYEEPPRPRQYRTTRRTATIPLPLLIAIAFFLAVPMQMGAFAWWLIIGFWLFRGCGGRRSRRVESRPTARDDTLISV